MRLADILLGVEVLRSNASTDMEIEDISYDSRKVLPGHLFVAVSGFKTDGYKYIASAKENGAVCVISEKEPDCDIPYVIVEDARRALASVSANYFGNPTSRMKIIGVTGTNGKTTVTNLLKTVIEKTLDVKTGLIGTNKNMIGSIEYDAERTTPESYELQKLFKTMADEGCKYVLMEVSSHSLVLDRVFGIEFEAGVFTNLTEDHLDFHKTMESYAAAKSLLFSRSRKSVINIDDAYSDIMMQAAGGAVFTYSAEDEKADLTALNIKINPDGVEFLAETMTSSEKVRLGIPGMFSVYNALAVLLTAVSLGIPLKKAAEALKKCQGVLGRAEVVPTGRNFSILIDYAHTPDALENILDTVNSFKKGRSVLVFGCGGDREKEKRPIMGAIAGAKADFSIVTSDNPRTEVPSEIISEIVAGMKDAKNPFTVIENRHEAIGYAIENAGPGDVIILAGKGHEKYQIIGQEKRHFDEREIVAGFLQKK